MSFPRDPNQNYAPDFTDHIGTARRWIFTSFAVDNPPPLEQIPELVYGIYQKEITPTTQREHLQGYLHFKSPTRMSAIHKLPGLANCFLAIARGTPQQCRDYCSKEETRVSPPVTFGTFKFTGQGSRTDIHSFKESVDRGMVSKRQIWEEHPTIFLKYPRGVDQVLLLTAKPRDFQTELHVLVGPTNTGKTSYVKELSPDAYWAPGNDKWFDGYNGTSDVVFDDFYGSIPYSELLRLANLAPHQVETKGGHVNFAAKRIFITSNVLPTEWYHHEKIQKNFDSLFRRISQLYIFTGLKSFDLYSSWEEYTLRPLPPIDDEGN